MRLKLTISTHDGLFYEGEVQLMPVGARAKKKSAPKKHGRARTPSVNFDFTLPPRAFVTANNARKLSGPQKFTLLLAGLTKGVTTVTVSKNRIQKEWNKMTAPMGGRFNPAYSTRAKDKGWVESPKQGVYKLRASWSDAIPS
jgi:hypothetical protein